MLLWILIALLTAAAILAVLVPLARAPKGGAAAAHAARVYRDQLDELERDKAEGRISASEAEAARAEIARRLIAVDGEARGQAPAAAQIAGRQDARRGVALVALLGIPILSLAPLSRPRRAEPAGRSRSPRGCPRRCRPTMSSCSSRRSRSISPRIPRTAAAGR